MLLSIAVIVSLVPYFRKQHTTYGSLFEFAEKSKKAILLSASVVFVGLFSYLLTPYTPPASDELAIIVGNTKNSPRPAITSDISDSIRSTMLRYAGEDISYFNDAFVVISAVKNPDVIRVSTQLKSISNNSAVANRNANFNIDLIEEELNSLLPNESGANYLESIFKARDNLDTDSRIVVIGSGLSDNGELNFSKSNILIDKDVRKESIDKIIEKYGPRYLENYTVEFYGLGDTVDPQEDLSSIQKGVLRDIYKEVVRGLGGKAVINTKTISGQSVETKYNVGTTNTGCGDIKLIFDSDDLNFNPDKSSFVDKNAALSSLRSITKVWDENSVIVEKIEIDGYIAFPMAPGSKNDLSKERATSVKNALVELGIPSDVITSKGKGVGPFKTPEENRIVIINIIRDDSQCDS